MSDDYNHNRVMQGQQLAQQSACNQQRAAAFGYYQEPKASGPPLQEAIHTLKKRAEDLRAQLASMDAKRKELETIERMLQASEGA